MKTSSFPANADLRQTCRFVFIFVVYERNRVVSFHGFATLYTHTDKHASIEPYDEIYNYVYIHISTDCSPGLCPTSMSIIRKRIFKWCVPFDDEDTDIRRLIT